MCMETHMIKQELAQYVDALVLDQQDQLRNQILEHVEDCMNCKKEIIETLDLIWTVETFDNSSKQ